MHPINLWSKIAKPVESAESGTERREKDKKNKNPSRKGKNSSNRWDISGILK